MSNTDNLNLVVEVTDTLSGIGKDEWNELDLHNNPFVHYEFLATLEETGCVGKDSGWYPRYFLLKAVAADELAQQTAAEDAPDTEPTVPSQPSRGKLLAVCPCYIKMHSYGEFVFDWAWADAYERHGLSYYPKMISAIPFTPATGPRILINRDLPEENPDENENNADDPAITGKAAASLLIETILEFCRTQGFSSMHWLFTEEAQHELLLQHKLMSRLDCQYHWHNNGYTSFDDFLSQCNSKRRKTIRRERRYVTDAKLRVERRLGSSLNSHEWSLVHEFYCATFDSKWGSPSLTLEFFQQIGRDFGDNCLIVLAYSDGSDPIATSIMFFSDDTLYGRFWGASEDHHCLHFEACYYQGIEFCIEKNIKNFEPGAQGEHKITRGFEPTFTRSAHWIAHEGFGEAVERYLREERDLIEQRREGLTERLPFRLEP